MPNTEPQANDERHLQGSGRGSACGRDGAIRDVCLHPLPTQIRTEHFVVDNSVLLEPKRRTNCSFIIDYGKGLYIAWRLDFMPSCVSFAVGCKAPASQSLDIILGWARSSQTKLLNGVGCCLWEQDLSGCHMPGGWIRQWRTIDRVIMHMN